MIDLTLNTVTEIAKAVATITFKAGAPVFVRITLDADPGAVPAFELALAAQTSSPTTLCYLASTGFTAESATVFTAEWDTNDTRLMNFVTGKQNITLDLEVAWTLDGSREIAPNVPVQVQRKIVDGPESSEGGPSYYTQAQVNALLAAATKLTSPDAHIWTPTISNAGIVTWTSN